MSTSVRIDGSLARRRQNRIWEHIRTSSPVLVWPCLNGIVILAANKHKHARGWRIFPVHDRMAFVTRGEYTAGKVLAAQVISHTYTRIADYGPAEIDPAEIIGGVGTHIAERFQHPLMPPLSAQAILVRLESRADDDFIAHANHKGDVQRADGALYLGPIDEDSNKDDAEEAHPFQEDLNRLWNSNVDPRSVSDLVLANPVLGPAMSTGARLETVLLDRTAVQKRLYSQTFVRL